MSQYALELSLTPLYRRENLVISGCNQSAWQWVESWPDWPAKGLMLTGPEGSGKSHIAALWQARAHASRLSATQLDDEKPATGHWLIEDVTHDTKPRALLHWINYVREHGGTILMTSRHSIAELDFTLKDLDSRLRALPATRIEQPDDTVLEGVLRKQLMDRQLGVDEEVIAYITARMERSLPAVKKLVSTLDQAALSQKRAITVPFVRETLNW